MVLKFHIQTKFLNDLVRGRKVLEGKLGSGSSWDVLNVGDNIICHDGINNYLFKVVEIRSWKSFYCMIKDVGMDKVLPSLFDEGKSIEDGVELYYSFGDRKKKIFEEKMYGVKGYYLKFLNEVK